MLYFYIYHNYKLTIRVGKYASPMDSMSIGWFLIRLFIKMDTGIRVLQFLVIFNELYHGIHHHETMALMVNYYIVPPFGLVNHR